MAGYSTRIKEDSVQTIRFCFDLVLAEAACKSASDFSEHRFSVVCLLYVLLLFKRFLLTVA